MNILIGKLKVDVARKDCADRPCFQLGFDKGSFSQGRGYTSYHEKERPVCLTRHLRGCPHASVCPQCHTAEIDEPGARCRWGKCAGITIPRAVTERLEWVRIAPVVTHKGTLCMLCDSMAGCSHPRVKCAACGTEGLKENWPFRCCNVADGGGS